MMLFRSNLEANMNRTLVQFYANFNKLSEKVKEIFPITGDVKEMQKRWNKLMVHVFLRSIAFRILKKLL